MFGKATASCIVVILSCRFLNLFYCVTLWGGGGGGGGEGGRAILNVTMTLSAAKMVWMHSHV